MSSFIKRNNIKGFTLIELVIVLFIISLLLGTATPTLKRALEKQAVVGFAKQLAGDIRYVRQRNINGEIFPPVSIQIWEDRYLIRTGTTVLEVKDAPKGVKFLDSSLMGKRLYFTSLGAPGGDIGAATIDITNSFGDIYQVIIVVGTGRVRTQPHPNKW